MVADYQGGKHQDGMKPSHRIEGPSSDYQQFRYCPKLTLVGNLRLRWSVRRRPRCGTASVRASVAVHRLDPFKIEARIRERTRDAFAIFLRYADGSG